MRQEAKKQRVKRIAEKRSRFSKTKSPNAMLINGTNVSEKSCFERANLLSSRYDKKEGRLFCVSSPLDGLLLRRQFLPSFSLACGVRFVEVLFIQSLFNRVIRYSVFCSSLVPVAVFPNLFPAPLRSPQIVYDDQRLGAIFLFVYLVHARLVLPECKGLRHPSPRSPRLYRYRTRSALALLRQKSFGHDVAHQKNLHRYFVRNRSGGRTFYQERSVVEKV